MAVLSNTGTATPVVGAETVVATIAPGGPLDNLTVYVVGGIGGGGGPLEYALYAEVGGFQTRVAQKQIVGSNVATILDFDTGLGPLAGGTAGVLGQTEQVDAGGTNYTVTVIDLSSGFLPPGGGARQPVTVTIAAVDSFDTVTDQNFGALLGPLAPGASASLTTMNGYAQLMDVAIDQTNLSPVTVTVSADCGSADPVLASVQAPVVSVTMAGADTDIASVFRGIKLPVATRYFVTVTNASSFPLSVTLTAVTYSVSITSGGVVALLGDVIGPSNNNTVIKWDNVPLLRGAVAGSFDLAQLSLSDAEVPIFDAALGEWRAFALSGGATMNNLGVVTIAAGSLALVGNTNGPANANTLQSFATSTTNADITVAAQPNPTGEIYEGFNGLTGPHSGFLNPAPVKGDKVIWKDEDGSLATQNFTVNGNGKLIDGAATFVMTSSNVGAFGSITVLYTGTAWAIV